MTADHIDDDERSTTRRSVLKAGLIASAVGIGGAATGMAQTDTASEDDNGTNGDTHTLTVSLIETRDASVVSGEVTVNGQTKTTRPIEEDSVIIQTEFELEDGTYTVSGTFDRGETWRTNEREVTIDGENKNISLLLYPPGSDELEENDGDTHTLTVALVESGDASVVSGEVTVNGQTKTTAPVDGDSAIIQTEFELEDGTYTVSGTFDGGEGETWRTNEQEVTIDGDDEYLSLLLYPPGSDELEENDGDTHTLTVYLVESEDADIVSGEVTVDGQTKPTTSDDPHVWSADFELENGTYTVSGTSDAYSDWRTNEREITIEGDNMAIELFLYPPGSDELEETDPEDGGSQDDADDSDNTDDDPSDETDSEENNGQSSSDDDSQDDAESSDDTDDDSSDEMNSEEDDEQSSPDVADNTSSIDQKQDTDDCP